MEKIKRILENSTWHTQLLYGLILAIFFGGATLLSGFHPAWSLVQILAVAVLREYYMDFVFLSFNWRNFFFLQVPILLIYILITL